MKFSLRDKRRLRNLNVGTKDERNFLRVVICAGIGLLLFLASMSTSPVFHSVGKQFDNVITSFKAKQLGRSLSVFESESVIESNRSLFVQEDCEIIQDCGVDGANCEINEAFENVCCLKEGNTDFEELLTCRNFKIQDTVCPAADLCVAELIPASEEGALCLADFERGASGIILYLFLLIYFFLALAIVCDDYFTFALDMIGDLLGLSSDVKGATFAAIGSSAPELFVSLADNVIANPPKSVGIGTIVGSAIFNILVIIGASGVVAGNSFGHIKLDYKPLLRDSFFYVVSILALITAIVTVEGNGVPDGVGTVRHYEGAILVLLYGTYLTFMVFNQRIFVKIDKFFGITPKTEEAAVDLAEPALDEPVKTLDNIEAEVETTLKHQDSEASHAAGTGFSSGARANLKRGSTLGRGRTRKNSMASAIGKGKLEEDMENIEDEPYFSVLYWPMYEHEINKPGLLGRLFGGGFGFWVKRFYFILVLPINILFRLTIPDARYDLFCEDKNGVTNRRKIAYWLEFFMCIVHIGIISHLLVFSASKFGCIASIPASVMGLTILAAGTSVPDMITSVILTRNGEGDAAVANSIGSNVFDILIGLGLPWFLAEFVFSNASVVAIDDVTLAVGFLFGVLFILLIALAVTRFKLNRRMGVGLLLLYVFYVIFELVIRPNTSLKIE